MTVIKSLLEFASTNPVIFTILLISVLGFLFIFFKTFKVSFKKGFFPNIETRSGLKTQDDLKIANDKIKDLEEKLSFSHIPDFIKKTDNGEYIGFIISPKPYITVWVDGNWNSEEHHQLFDRFDRLWDDEQEILLIGKSPNIPSDLYHVIEKKAKSLPKITIHCSYQLGEFFNRYFSDFENIEIKVR